MNKGKVIVVGGGAAGIAAATKLVLHGFNVTVLEAENRLGGRCNTISIGTESVDLGAQWIHGENIIYEIASSHDMIKDSIVSVKNLINSNFFYPNGKVVDKEISSILAIYCLNILTNNESDLSNRALSLGDVYVKRFNEGLHALTKKKISREVAEQFLNWYERLENSLESSDSWFDVSYEGFLKYKECEGNPNIAWKYGGYSNIIDILLLKVPESKKEVPVNVIYEKEVVQISYDQGVTIQCSDNSTFTADHVIVTVSLGVLKNCARSMFKPPLSFNKLTSINTLEFGAAEKLFFQFPDQWWPHDLSSFNFLWDAESTKEFKAMVGREWLLEVFTFFCMDNAPSCLCCWIGGNSARFIANLPDETVEKDLMFLLNRFLSKTYNIPKPSRFFRSTWFGNPHFRGSYSYVSVQANIAGSSSEILAEPILDDFRKPVVLFAGEATHPQFFSTVHGAVETGWREADRLIELYEKPNSVDTVIVGAGMAGLGAALTLHNNNVDFLLLEAQNYVGGRVLSIYDEDIVLEMGAQWLHGTDNDLYLWAEKKHLLSDKISHEGKGLFVRDDKTKIPQETVDEVNEIVGDMLKRLEDFSPFKEDGTKTVTNCPLSSVAQFLSSEFEKSLSRYSTRDEVNTVKQLFHWHERFQVVDNACNTLDDLPVSEWGTYSLNGKQDNINLNKGYSALVHSIYDSLPRYRVKLNSPVSKIQWLKGSFEDISFCNFHEISASVTDYLLQKLKLSKYVANNDERQCSSVNKSFYPLRISCEDGSQILAQHVIVTCSLGFLKAHHRSFFDPHLPAPHYDVIENIGFGAIDKIFLIFEEPWWGESAEGFQLIWSESTSHRIEQELELGWISNVTGFDVLSNEPAVLVGWLGGPGAKVMENLPLEKLRKDCQKLLQRFLTIPIPLPVKVYRSQWINNPYILGGYSHSTIKCSILGYRTVDLNKIISFETKNSLQHPVILIAGEANSEHDFSTTHGAFHSGIDRARIIIDYHNKTTLKRD